LVARNPKTTFIGAHFGCNAEDVATVASWLDKYPNLYIDIDARISELGRQPYTARKFFLKYQDRVMFGTDTTCKREAYRIYFRFLETDDEYFDCAASHHLQGFWMIYGVFLPKDVLEKLYYKNAERILYFGPDKPAASSSDKSSSDNSKVLKVKRTDDFDVTGDGSSPAWQKTSWEPLANRSGDKSAYPSQFKVLYSPTGLYVLMNGDDRKLTATEREDFADLWNEDVFEFFLWPDERQTVYLEYEISPLNRELAILVPNIDGEHHGWRPWHYEGLRKTRKATSVAGGEAKPGADITGWTAEVFVPYTLLEPLGNVPPHPQTRWRANFYRCDYDNGHGTGWNWAQVGPSYHDFEHFGVLEFE
jgi:hypothetical protein